MKLSAAAVNFAVTTPACPARGLHFNSRAVLGAAVFALGSVSCGGGLPLLHPAQVLHVHDAAFVAHDLQARRPAIVRVLQVQEADLAVRGLNDHLVGLGAAFPMRAEGADAGDGGD